MKLGEPCEFCAEPGTRQAPTYEYQEGYFAHDQCADEAGVPESEML